MRFAAVCVLLCGRLLGSQFAIAQSAAPESALSIGDARITVTGYDVNRPAPFPGAGDFGWAGNIQRLPDGRLLLVHQWGYWHVSFAEPRMIEPNLAGQWASEGWPLDFTAPTGGRSMLCTSNDGGRTWSQPRTILDLPQDDSPYGLLRLDDGTLLCFINVQASWYGYDRAPPEMAKVLNGLNTAQCVIRSTDQGRSWSDPVYLKSPGRFYERSHAQPIALDDGRILWPTYCLDTRDGLEYAAVHRSDDAGQTWHLAAIVRRDRKRLDEPAIAQLVDGQLLMVGRPDGAVFHSSDRGENWQQTGRIPATGTFKAPRLFVLSDGTIVCAATIGSLCVFLSTDHGRTWSESIPLDKSCYGYPGGTKLDDDSVLVSYVRSGNAPSRIYVVRFRVNDTRDGIELMAIDDDRTPGRPASSGAQRTTGDSIEVVRPKTLAAGTIACERIALGEPDDYKPCIARLPSGELLLSTFHQYPREGGKVMEQTLLFRSADGGRNWTGPEKLNLLGREPYLTVASDGTVFMTGHLLAQDVRNPHGYTHGYLHRSTDAGRTWESVRVESENVKPGAGNHTSRNVLELADGSFLVGVDYDGGGGPYFVWRSTDGGRSWDKSRRCRPNDFKSVYGFFGGETWLWQARSGKIWALVRVDSNELPIEGRPITSKNDQSDHFIAFSSNDQGRTFDRIKDLGDYGEMYMSILRLVDRRLLLTFTVRDLHPPLGVRAIPGIETNDGFAFDFAHDRILLDTKTGDRYQGGGFGPTVQLDDGTLVTSCSYRGADDKTHLEVIRWRLPAGR